MIRAKSQLLYHVDMGQTKQNQILCFIYSNLRKHNIFICSVINKRKVLIYFSYKNIFDPCIKAKITFTHFKSDI